MKQYLASALLQRKVAEFWELGRPVGAICHGVLVLARSGVLAGSRTTCLPKFMERSAYLATAWRHGRYYRTYPEYVEDEVKAALDDPGRFERGPRGRSAAQPATTRTRSFVEDGRYVSARWPGDAYLFARRFEAALRREPARPATQRRREVGAGHRADARATSRPRRDKRSTVAAARSGGPIAARFSRKPSEMAIVAALPSPRSIASSKSLTSTRSPSARSSCGRRAAGSRARGSARRVARAPSTSSVTAVGTAAT